MVTIRTIETPSLGDRSYLAHDGEVALVVDPQRDIDRVLAVAEADGVRITHVLETHLHNDYLTGGFALARATGATYLTNGEDKVAFARQPIHDGDVIEVSPAMTLRVLATPGHTFTHLSYALESSGESVAVFTGGSLLFGAMGRPDLLGEEHTEALVHHQFASAHRLADTLPDTTQVLPTHGFGSFCSPGSSSEATESTIGEEKRANPALTEGEERWVADTLAGLDAYPAYYAHMTPGNVAGPSAPNLNPPRVATREVLVARISAGDWVVDLRHRRAFARGHVVGSLNIGLDGQFATYVGWLLPWRTPLTLLGDSAAQVTEAQRELVRIGMDELHGAASGTPEQWTDAPLGSFPTATFADLSQVRHHRPITLLDVRRASEFTAKHLEGATNIPIHELLSRLAEVPQGEVWVHCASGYRAAIAASALAGHGREVVVIDDDFAEHATDAGLPLVSAA